MASVVKNPPTNAGDFRNTGFFLGWEDPLEEGMSTHFALRILAWENLKDRGVCHTIVHRVTKSWTQLKQLSMHEI